MLMCVPNVSNQEGIEGEIFWHFSEITKSLLKKGVLPSEFVGEPLPEIRVAWRQTKQGKGRNKAERSMSLNNLPGYCQNGCLACSVEASERAGNIYLYCGSTSTRRKTGLCHWALGRRRLMVVNYSGCPTDTDRSILQCFC